MAYFLYSMRLWLICVSFTAPIASKSIASGMPTSIAFVGAGPTTIYAIHALISRATVPFALTIIEEQAAAGCGTPYRPGWNDPAMLSNIASIELPPLGETLVDWLRKQPVDRLRQLQVDPEDIDDRAFFPRLALGAYFRDRFEAIIQHARLQEVAVEIRTRCRAVDAAAEPDGIRLSIKPERGALFEALFDHVVLATGHQWPEEPEARPGYFLSPWPAKALARVPATHVGIRGTSLTAIDASVALAVNHGAFEQDGTDGLFYRSNRDAGDFHLTMMSRKGLLPEADFFHPIPYEPLSICTAEAVDALISDGLTDLLDRTFALFKAELAQADPDYAARASLDNLDLEHFCDRFFAQRLAADPFDWARRNLAEAKRNFERVFTVPWRYAILRMHEVVSLIVPHLDDDAFARFSRYWKPVFIDDYATVPHESIERMLALHEAGRLELLELGEDYRIDSHSSEFGAVLRIDGRALHFPVFIEATGQRALEAVDFPLPTLREQGIIRDAPTSEDGPPRGIVIDELFRPVADDLPSDRLFCPSLPFILGRHPFAQGITSSHQMGEIVGARLATVLAQPSGGSAIRSDMEAECP